MIFYSPSSSSLSSLFMITSVPLCFILAEPPLSIAFNTAPNAINPFISPTAIRILESIYAAGGMKNAMMISSNPIILNSQKNVLSFK